MQHCYLYSHKTSAKHFHQELQIITQNEVITLKEKLSYKIYKENPRSKDWQVNAHKMSYDEVLDCFLSLHDFEEVTQKVAERLFGPSFVTLVRDTGKRAGNKVIYKKQDLAKRVHIFCKTKTFERKNEFLQMQRYQRAMKNRANITNNH